MQLRLRKTVVCFIKHVTARGGLNKNIEYGTSLNSPTQTFSIFTGIMLRIYLNKIELHSNLEGLRYVDRRIDLELFFYIQILKDLGMWIEGLILNFFFGTFFKHAHI